MSLAIPIDDLLRWNDLTAQRWHDHLQAHPALLAVPCDVRNSSNVAQVLQHIVAVELRYAQRLASQPESTYDEVPFGSPDEIFTTHQRALDLIRPLLADPAYDWNHPLDFQTITLGEIRATRRDILLHTLFHGIRHYAQLATQARTAGFTPTWPMDFLMLNAVRV
jgi:uncharacterized damage-inducible protein DinB